MQPSDLFTALAMIERDPGAKEADLSVALGASPATTQRLIRALRRDYGVDIVYVRGGLGEGQYEIRDWGVFDRRRVLEAANIPQA